MYAFAPTATPHLLDVQSWAGVLGHAREARNRLKVTQHLVAASAHGTVIDWVPLVQQQELIEALKSLQQPVVS